MKSRIAAAHWLPVRTMVVRVGFRVTEPFTKPCPKDNYLRCKDPGLDIGLLVRILSALGYTDQEYVRTGLTYAEAAREMYDGCFDAFGSYSMGRKEFDNVGDNFPNKTILRYQPIGRDKAMFLLGAHLYRQANASFIRHLFHYYLVIVTTALYVAVKFLKVRFRRRQTIASWSFWLVFGGLCSVFANVLTVFIASGPTLTAPFHSLADMELAVRSGRCTLIFSYEDATQSNRDMLASDPPVFVHWDKYRALVLPEKQDFQRAVQDSSKVSCVNFQVCQVLLRMGSLSATSVSTSYRLGCPGRRRSVTASSTLFPSLDRTSTTLVWPSGATPSLRTP